MADKSPTRPKNVVMVDADNPLVEVRGEFFWREDHERAVDAARQEAYRDGYSDACTEAARRTQARQIVIRRRAPLLVRIVRRCALAVMVFAFLASVVLAVIQAVLSRG